MVTRHKIPFDGPVSNLMRKEFPDSKMNKSGRALIAEIMQEIHLLLLKNFENEYESKKKITDDTVLKCIQKAVSKIFPPDIRQHAFTEANRQLILFQSGQLEYDHVTSIKALKLSPEYSRKSGKKNTGTVYDFFSSGVAKMISKMASNNYPALKIENNAKQFLGLYLYNMANQIANTASENATEKSLLEYTDIRNVLPEFLTSDALCLAYSEGSRGLFEHTTDFISTEVAEQSHREGLKEIDFMHVNRIMCENFSQILLNHAVNSGFVCVKNYAKGILKYKKRPPPVPKLDSTRKRKREPSKRRKTVPSKRRKTEPSKRHKIAKEPSKSRSKKEGKLVAKSKLKGKAPNLKQAARYLEIPPTNIAVKKTAKGKKLNFSKAILNFFERACFGLSVSIGSEATAMINKCLLDICNSLITQCTIQQSSVTAETIRTTVESYLPREISRHAISEGQKKVFLTRVTPVQRQDQEIGNEVQMDIQQEPEAAESAEFKPESAKGEEHVKKEEEEAAADDDGNEDKEEKDEETAPDSIPDEASTDTS